MYGFEHGAMAWGWTGMIFMWLIPFLLIVLLVRFFVGTSDGRTGGHGRDILDERYANGEIDRDEYINRRGDLAK